MDSMKIHAPKPIKAASNTRGIKIINGFEKINNVRVSSYTPKPGKQQFEQSEQSTGKIEGFHYKGGNQVTINSLNLKSSLLVDNHFKNSTKHRYSKTNFNIDFAEIENDFSSLCVDNDNWKSKSEILSILNKIC